MHAKGKLNRDSFMKKKDPNYPRDQGLPRITIKQIIMHGSKWQWLNNHRR